MLVEPLVQGQLELKSKALGASERSLRLTGLYSHPRVIPGPKLSISDLVSLSLQLLQLSQSSETPVMNENC
jgi:hypothetical protein